MKGRKFLKGLCRIIAITIVVTAIQMALRIGLDGMWLFGIPKASDVTSVTIVYRNGEEQRREIADPEQIEFCVNVTAFLRYKPFADAEMTEEEGPVITLHYHLDQGGEVEVTGSNKIVSYKGKNHLLKDDHTFINFMEGMFFPMEEIRD